MYLIYSSYSKIIEANLTIAHYSNFYTLVPYKDGDNYNFILGYITPIIKLDYYTFNTEGNSIILNKSINPDIPNMDGSEHTTSYFGYSYHIMISNFKGKVLTFFYERINVFGVCSFNLKTFDIIDDLYRLYNNNISTGYIHSDISQDKTKALICYLNIMGEGVYCLNYDINQHKLSTLELYSKACIKNPSSINVFYSIKSQEYIFSSYNYDGITTVCKFDKDFNVIVNNYTFKYESCSADFSTIIYD